MENFIKPGGFRPKMPFHVVWLATNACNAKCLHCSSNSGRPYPNELNTKEACKLFEDLSQAGVVDIAFSGGEPLLREDFFELIQRAVSLGFSVGVGSNGGNLSCEKIEKMFEVGINRLQISLDGFGSTHDKIRGWGGLFNLALKSIKNSIKIGLRTHVCITINRFNFEEFERFVSFIASIGINRINISRYIPTGRVGTEILDLNSDQWRFVINKINNLRKIHRGRVEIVSHLAQEILLDSNVGHMPSFIGCQAGVGQGCITARGEVWPCVLLPIPLGNIREKDFDEIWKNSKVIKALRCRENLEGFCGACDSRNQCGGCRAVAFAKTGNYLASDPRCWKWKN